MERLKGLIVNLNDNEIVNINDGEMLIQASKRHNQIKLVFAGDKNKYKVFRQEIIEQRRKNERDDESNGNL